jgi:hypothetical protein
MSGDDAQARAAELQVDLDVPDRLNRKERAVVEQLAELRGERGLPLNGRLRPR